MGDRTKRTPPPSTHGIPLVGIFFVLMPCATFYIFRGSWWVVAHGVVMLLFAAFSVFLSIARMRTTARFFFGLFHHSEQLEALRKINGDMFFNLRTAPYTAANFLFIFVGIPYLIIAICLGINWWSIPTLLASGAFNVASRQLLPPIAVFLSASESQQIALCAELQYTVFPLRIINLLSSEMVTRQKYLTDRLVALDGYRLTQNEGWEKHLEQLMSCIPVIIIDMRSSSAGLLTECAIINRRGWHWKVVAIYSDEYNIEVLEREFFQLTNTQKDLIFWVRAADLPRAIVHSLIVGKQLPCITRPTGRLFSTPEHDYEGWRWGEDQPRRKA